MYGDARSSILESDEEPSVADAAAQNGNPAESRPASTPRTPRRTSIVIAVVAIVVVAGLGFLDFAGVGPFSRTPSSPSNGVASNGQTYAQAEESAAQSAAGYAGGNWTPTLAGRRGHSGRLARVDRPSLDPVWVILSGEPGAELRGRHLRRFRRQPLLGRSPGLAVPARRVHGHRVGRDRDRGPGDGLGELHRIWLFHRERWRGAPVEHGRQSARRTGIHGRRSPVVYRGPPGRFAHLGRAGSVRERQLVGGVLDVPSVGRSSRQDPPTTTPSRSTSRTARP